MKKRRIFPVRSLGAEEPDPALPELASWTGRQRGVAADLISFKLERSLASQREIDRACAGGIYYGSRVTESVIGLAGGVLLAEPGAEPGAMIDDARRLRRMRKCVWCALPLPSLLGIGDGYFNDPDEHEAAVCEVYGRLMREMRDAGVQGHVLLGDTVSPIEAEELRGKRTFFFSPESSPGVITRILEAQDEIAVPAERLQQVIGLLNEYDIRRLILVDAGPADFAIAAEHFDPDDLIAGGYFRGAGPAYWSERIASAYCLL